MHDERLDLSSEPPRRGARPCTRPFLGVHFACCGAYQRAYLDGDGVAYVGRCPRCGGSVRFPVGQGGSTARFFRAE